MLMHREGTGFGRTSVLRKQEAKVPKCQDFYNDNTLRSISTSWPCNMLCSWDSHPSQAIFHFVKTIFSKAEKYTWIVLRYVIQNGSPNIKDFDFDIKTSQLGLWVLSTIDTWKWPIPPCVLLYIVGCIPAPPVSTKSLTGTTPSISDF